MRCSQGRKTHYWSRHGEDTKMTANSGHNGVIIKMNVRTIWFSVWNADLDNTGILTH